MLDEQLLLLEPALGQMSNIDEIRYSPSLVAVASLTLARHTMGAEVWPVSLAEFSGIDVCELQECLLVLHATYFQAEDYPQ